jgi:hypothetical protein
VGAQNQGIHIIPTETYDIHTRIGNDGKEEKDKGKKYDSFFQGSFHARKESL